METFDGSRMDNTGKNNILIFDYESISGAARFKCAIELIKTF